MNGVQTIKSFSQNHACKVPTPQIASHHAHSSIKATGLLYQEVSWEDTQIEGIKIVGVWSTDHKNS